MILHEWAFLSLFCVGYEIGQNFIGKRGCFMEMCYVTSGWSPEYTHM